MVIAAGVAILVATGGVITARGHGPLAALLCPRSVTGYAQVPYPAPPLTHDTRLRVGQEGSLGGYGDPLPADDPPALVGDRSVVRIRTVVRATERRCGRVVEGYRFFVVTAVRPGEVTVLPPRSPGSPQPPLSIVVLAT